MRSPWYCPWFPGSVVCSKTHCKIGNWEEELAWNMQRRSKKFSQGPRLFFFSLLFQRALPGTGWCRDFICCIWCIYVPLPQSVSQGWTLMVVDSHSGGHYLHGVSETSNITVLTSAECTGDFPLCWLCCYMAKAKIWSCLAGTLLPGHRPHSEAKLKVIFKRFR